MTADGASPATRLEPGSFASFLAFFWRHRILIAVVVGVATLGAIVAVLVMPKEYTARAVLLPQSSEEPGLLSTAMSLLGGSLAGLSTGGLVGQSGVELAVARSERLADAVNERLNLEQKYKLKRRESRLRRWYATFDTRPSRQGMLVLTFRDRDPKFAAQVVATVIEELGIILGEIRTTAGGRQREFLEGRIEETRGRMRAVEDSLAAYQSRHQGAVLAVGTESAIQAGADLLTQRVRLETETQVLRQTLGGSAPALRAKELEIVSLDRELAKLPALGSEAARLTRDLKVQERTYALLSAQLEDARLREAQDAPRVQVLDPPVVPTLKSHPRRTITVLIVMALSGLVALILGAITDAARRVREVQRA